MKLPSTLPELPASRSPWSSLPMTWLQTPVHGPPGVTPEVPPMTVAACPDIDAHLEVGADDAARHGHVLGMDVDARAEAVDDQVADRGSDGIDVQPDASARPVETNSGSAAGVAGDRDLLGDRWARPAPMVITGVPPPSANRMLSVSAVPEQPPKFPPLEARMAPRNEHVPSPGSAASEVVFTRMITPTARAAKRQSGR